MKKSTAMIVLLASVVVATPFVWRVGKGTVRAEEEESIKINESNFPDKVFRDYVKSSFDTDSDGTLSAKELNKVKKINISLEPGAKRKAKSLKGVEFFKELRTLEFDCNEVTSLDLSANTKLETLSCYYNMMTELNLKGCCSLKSVYCAINNLENIDLSDCVELGYLDVSENMLKSIDVSKCAKLVDLHVDAYSYWYARPDELGMWVDDGTHNPITKLELRNNPDLVNLSASNTCLKRLDVSMLQKLEYLELDSVSTLGGSNLTIGSLPNLDTLVINFCNLSTLDISKCPKLETLLVFSGNLSKLDLSNNKELVTLDMTLNNFRSIDLSNCTKLERLGLESNPLKTIDVSMLPDLTSLDVSSCQLTKLDLSKNPKLTFVAADSNELTDIQFANVEILDTVRLYGNKLTSLDLSQAQNLTSLCVDENELTELNVSSSTELDYLTCTNNKLTSLDLSHCTKLRWLECYHNVLTELKVSNCRNMEFLNCSANQLTEIDVSNMKKLQDLRVDNNKDMTKLVLPKNSALQTINCNDMSLTELDASDLPNLKTLYCFANQLTSLNVKNDTSLELLSCTSNQLTDLDLRGLHKLKGVYCQSNKLQDMKLDSDNLELLLMENNELKKLDLTQCESFFNAVKKYGFSQSSDGKYFECYVLSEKGEQLDLLMRLDSTIEEVVGVKLPELTQGFEAFVERLYTIALNRASDPEGKKYWVDQVENNGATGADCARFFLLDAPEFAQRNLSNEDFLETLYKVFFNRESDKDGREFYLGELRKGVTRAQIIDDFIESDEWCDLCIDFGIASGAKFPHGSKQMENVIAFVDRLYYYCLNREADEVGQRFWVAQLLNKKASGIQAARFFFGSEEMKSSGLSNEEFVMRLYYTFFDRVPEYDGEVYWKGELDKGVSRESVVDLFATSKEFRKICAQYGIEAGQL